MENLNSRENKTKNNLFSVHPSISQIVIIYMAFLLGAMQKLLESDFVQLQIILSCHISMDVHDASEINTEITETVRTQPRLGLIK